MKPHKLALLANSIILLALLVYPFAAPVVAKPQTTFTVTANNDIADATPGDGVCETATGNGMCTLRAAIMEANAHIGADTISLPAATYHLTIPGADEDLGATGDLDITESVTITGAGSGDTIIDADGLGDRALEIHNTADEAMISGIKIQKGSVVGSGGAILSTAALTLSDVNLYQNTAVDASGGGIYSTAPLTLTQVTVQYNHAGVGGGGITFGLRILNIEDSQFINNRADDDGGALLVSIGAQVHLVRTDFIMNDAVDGGGAIYSNSDLTMEGGSFTQDEAMVGGGLYITNERKATLTGVAFTGNNAAHAGGIAIGTGASLTGVSLLFDSNTAEWNGGAIQNMGGDIHLYYSTLRDNSADSGGALSNTPSAEATIAASTIISNTATTLGGGIYNSGSMEVKQATLNANRAENGGGAYNNGTLLIENSTLSGNSATTNGGGIYNTFDGHTWLFNATLTANLASAELLNPGGEGGGFYTEMPNITMRNTIVYGNHHRQLVNFVDDDCYGVFFSGDYNLIGVLTNCGFWEPVAHDLIGVDPLLGPLADNGGKTHTHALLDGSPAIDGANPGGCLGIDDAGLYFDQRGFNRRVDGDKNGSAICDIGAYEVSNTVYMYLPLMIK